MQDTNSHREMHRQVGVMMLFSFGIVGCATACGLLGRPAERPPQPAQAAYFKRERAVSDILSRLQNQTGIPAPPSR